MSDGGLISEDFARETAEMLRWWRRNRHQLAMTQAMAYREGPDDSAAADVLTYEEAYLVKPSGYTDGASEFSDSGGSNYRAALAYDYNSGNESTVGITHDSSVAYPYIDGNFTATKAGVYLCIFSIRCQYNFSGAATNGLVATFFTTALRRSNGTSYSSNASRLDWSVMYHDSYSWLAEYTTNTINFLIPLQVGDKMAIRCASGSTSYRAELAQSTLAITRIKDSYEEIWGWY